MIQQYYTIYITSHHQTVLNIRAKIMLQVIYKFQEVKDPNYIEVQVIKWSSPQTLYRHLSFNSARSSKVHQMNVHLETTNLQKSRSSNCLSRIFSEMLKRELEIVTLFKATSLQTNKLDSILVIQGVLFESTFDVLALFLKNQLFVTAWIFFRRVLFVTLKLLHQNLKT